MTTPLRPPDWTTNAACRIATNPTLWDDDGTPQARRICATCPVQLNCARYALHHAIPHGMWGGLTPHDRTTIARGDHGHTNLYERPGSPRHGTRSRYTAGCRCTHCREAHRRWKAAYTASRHRQASA